MSCNSLSLKLASIDNSQIHELLRTTSEITNSKWVSIFTWCVSVTRSDHWRNDTSTARSQHLKGDQRQPAATSSSTSADGSRGFKFDELPTEIRLNIWQIVLLQPRIIEIEPKHIAIIFNVDSKKFAPADSIRLIHELRAYRHWWLLDCLHRPIM
jgi:hypothetical protein